MRSWLLRLVASWRRRHTAVVKVTGSQSLAPGLAVFALDVDGRRIIVGVASHGMCVLDRYPTPENERDPATRLAKCVSE